MELRLQKRYRYVVESHLNVVQAVAAGIKAIPGVENRLQPLRRLEVFQEPGRNARGIDRAVAGCGPRSLHGQWLAIGSDCLRLVEDGLRRACQQARSDAAQPCTGPRLRDGDRIAD